MDNKQSQDTVGEPYNQPMNQAGTPSDNQSVAPPIQQTPEPSSGFAAQPVNQPTPQPMNQPQTQMSGHNNKKSNTKTIWIVAGVVVGLTALLVIVAIIANVVNNVNEFSANERAEYVYNGTTKSSNFSAASFKELIPATAGFFSVSKH